MKGSSFFLLIFLLLIHAPHAYTEEEQSKERYEDYIHAEKGGFRIPPGMEQKKVGDVRVLVPEGGKIFKAGDALVVESSGEYAARKFLSIESRFKKIEEEQKVFKKEIEHLKEAIYRIERKSSVSKEKSE